VQSLKPFSTVLATLFFVACATRAQVPAPQPAGLVASLNGTVKVARSKVSMTLQFRDNIVSHDRITTELGSHANILLTRKAWLIIHELSVLTITDGLERIVIELDKGKIDYLLPRDFLRPGEVHKIRTPNAIVHVRGTIVQVRGTVVVVRTEQSADGMKDSYVTQVDVPVGSALVGSVASPLMEHELGPGQRVTIKGNILGPIQGIPFPPPRWQLPGGSFDLGQGDGGL